MTEHETVRLATPSTSQLAWQDLEIGMFIHFAPNTWQNSQCDNLSTPLAAIAPDRLSVAQWVDVAEAMCARYIIFVAKHVGGFCMWPTTTTSYNIAQTPWRGGGGDVCGELADECARRGMHLGFYLSPRDDHFGVETGGRVRSQNPEHQALYDRLYVTQLTELLSRYGSLLEIWFDGSANGEMVRPIIEQHQPGAMVFQSSAATIRWIGNEDGVAPYPTWNTVGASDCEWSPEMDVAGAGPLLGLDAGARWVPAECDVPIRRDWFWTTENADTLKHLDHLMDLYYRSVGHGCNLLLNHTPDTSGLIPAADAARAAELGAEIRRRFAAPLGETSGTGEQVTLALPAPVAIQHVVTMEDIRHGERVLEYLVEARVGEGWQRIAGGSAIGHKRIDRVGTVTTSQVRLTCIRAVADPIIRSLAVY